MGFWSRTGQVLSHIADVRVDRWIDWPWLTSSARYFRNQARELLKIERAQYSESFEEAVTRLNLTPEILATQQKRYINLFFFFLILTAGLFLYTLFLIVMKNWMGILMGFSLTLYAFSQALRSHFWYFQISQQKLGCNIQEWFHHFIPFVKFNRRTKSQ